MKKLMKIVLINAINVICKSSLIVFSSFFCAISLAQTCTITIGPSADLTSTIAAANSGSTVICLNPGTYSPPTVAFPANGAFAVGNNVIVRGLGATPADVTLNGSSSVDHAVYFTNYLGSKNANGAQLINLTIQGSHGGIQVQNFTASPAGRLSNIKLKNVIINVPNVSTNGFGFKAQSADGLVLDNVTITSYQAAINLIDVTDTVVMNSNVTNTVANSAPGLSVLGGAGNRFVNNIIGSPRVGATYSFNGGGVVFYNSSDNRFENNTLQGMRDDALDFTIVDLSGNGIALKKSLNNYIGKNTIIHTAFPIDGKVLGSAGIWANCASDGTWIYGNDTSGTAECATCVWGSKSNMVLGNKFYNNGIVGVLVSGGQEALDNCSPAGSPAFQQKPQFNFIKSNAIFFNRNDQLVVRNSDVTEISRNFESPNKGLGGALQSCTNPACQAAYSLEVDSTPGYNTTSGVRVLANTSLNNARGLWVDSTQTTGIEFYLNRTLNSPNSRLSTNSVVNIDHGSVLGGNKWSQFAPAGNPSTTPYGGVFDSINNTTGKVVDRYPYQSNDMGRGYNISVFEPLVGSSIAQGTRRTVRWDSIGCVWVDLELGGVPLLQNTPNTGYSIVTIPNTATVGSASIVAKCKDELGVFRSQSSSPLFSVTPSGLKLVSPGRDDIFNVNQSIWVAWSNSPVSSTITIEYSPDGGTTWPNTLATVNNLSAANPVTSTRVQLPSTGSPYAMLRVRSGGNVDQTDGVFSLRDVTGATYSNVNPSRNFKMGQMERLEWSSPQNSRLVTLDATVGGTKINIATNLPDRGFFDWIVPDLGAGVLKLDIAYMQIDGTAISNATLNTAGNMLYPTTITFGLPPTITPPSTAALTVSTNSGVVPVLSGSTPSVCTVSGLNVTGVANGVCTVTANAAPSGNYAAALPSVLSFNLGQSQTITFNSLGTYLAVSSSINLSATASSGLPVVFSSLTPSVCAVSGNAVSGSTNGTCTVAADQPGNSTYAAAQQVQRTLQSVAAATIPRLANISTRMQVLTGNDVLIGGFVIGGSGNKTVVVRARGPSLASAGIANFLPNPMLQLFSGATQIAVNDNWQTAANQATLTSSGFAPSDALEAAIYVNLAPGAYTAIVTGVGGATGVGIIEVFEVDRPDIPLVNISTRGQVLKGSDVMIGGFIIQGTSAQTVAVRARGPSLAAAGISNYLANPMLQLFSGATELMRNDDWKTDANQAALLASGFAPGNDLEAAILVTLNPGAYTVIVTGSDGGTGVGIVEVFGQ